MESHAAPVSRAQITADVAAEVRRRFGTPCYVYDRAALEGAARAALAFPAPFGLTVRYAMKANPSRGILTLFRDLGLHVDASSDYEVERALRAGFAPDRVQLTSQMPSRVLREHVARGVLFNACSLHQLEEFGRLDQPAGGLRERKRRPREMQGHTENQVSSHGSAPQADPACMSTASVAFRRRTQCLGTIADERDVGFVGDERRDTFP